MLERFLFKEEERLNIVAVITTSFIITLVLGLFNILLGSNSLVLVALISLALSYPVIKYILIRDTEELTQQIYSKALLDRHGRELVILWGVFVGVAIGFFVIALTTTPDFSYQAAFVKSVTGHITQPDTGFIPLLLNNLKVGALTFALTTLVFSGLIFILVWNASILAYYLSTLGGKALSTAALLFGHGLLEVGGYTMLGIAGSLISVMLDRKWTKRIFTPANFWRDIILFIGIGLCLIVLGAIFETM